MTEGLFAHAAATPARPALIDADTGATRSYRDLVDRAARLATALDRLGLDGTSGGERAVASMLPNSPASLEVAAATCLAQARLLPVNWHLKRDELAWILADSGAGALVAHPDLRAHVDGALHDVTSTGVLWAGDDYEQAIADAAALAGEGWTTPAFLFYTSGTTGRPKGVVHAGLDPQRLHAAQVGLSMLWGFTADDVHLLAGPAYHAGPLGYALTTLFAGGAVAVLPAWDPRAAMRTIAEHRVTTTFLTPAHFVRLLEVPDDERAGYDLSSLRLVIHGGAPCPQAVKARILDALPSAQVWELYGASEGGATRASPDEWRARPGTVGTPWPGVEIRVLDEGGRPVPAGTDGVIHIRPAGGATFHYHRDDDKTAAAWRDEAFTVGDVGHLDEDGYLYITDRVSDMVLRDGVNVYPREIEEVLFDHPDVVDCAVLGLPDERRGEILFAVVERRGDTAGAADDLRAHVAARLADFKVPERWELVAELPRDPNGKVLKRVLRERYTLQAGSEL